MIYKCLYCGKEFKSYIKNRKCCSRSCSNRIFKVKPIITNYFTIHDRIRNHKPKPKLCENCHKEKKLTLANISGLYKVDVNDYKWLCFSCHATFDNKVRFFKEYYKKAERNKNGIFLSKKGTYTIRYKICKNCGNKFKVIGCKKYCDRCNLEHNFGHLSISKRNELRKRVITI